MEVGAGLLQAGELGTDVVVDRLVDQAQDGVEAVLAPLQRAGQAPVGADAAHGEERADATALRLGDDPLELADLVAAPAARTGSRP